MSHHRSARRVRTKAELLPLPTAHVRAISLENHLALAAILSAAMMLRHSLNLPNEARRVETAVKRVLTQGLRTADIWEAGTRKVGTSEMGDAVASALPTQEAVS